MSRLGCGGSTEPRTRSLIVRDGAARIQDKLGRVDLEAAVDALTVRLTKTRAVEVRTDTGSVIVYGISQLTKIAKELDDLAVRDWRQPLSTASTMRW